MGSDGTRGCSPVAGRCSCSPYHACSGCWEDDSAFPSSLHSEGLVSSSRKRGLIPPVVMTQCKARYAHSLWSWSSSPLLFRVLAVVLMDRQPYDSCCFGSSPPSSSCFQPIHCKVWQILWPAIPLQVLPCFLHCSNLHLFAKFQFRGHPFIVLKIDGELGLK